jgi:NADPH:quinone reductase
VQLAAWAGASVIATVGSEEKAARARAEGAAFVINHRTEDIAARVRDITGGELADHVVVVDLGGNPAATLASVRDGGSISYHASRGAAAQLSGEQGGKVGTVVVEPRK